jgi:hypothetical protein
MATPDSTVGPLDPLNYLKSLFIDTAIVQLDRRTLNYTLEQVKVHCSPFQCQVGSISCLCKPGALNGTKVATIRFTVATTAFSRVNFITVLWQESKNFQKN